MPSTFAAVVKSSNQQRKTWNKDNQTPNATRNDGSRYAVYISKHHTYQRAEDSYQKIA